jgi:hypothetical protein
MIGESETYPCITPGCPNMVTFTKKQEDFFRSKGFTNDKTTTGIVTKPKRCKACIAIKKSRLNQDQRNNFYK